MGTDTASGKEKVKIIIIVSPVNFLALLTSKVFLTTQTILSMGSKYINFDFFTTVKTLLFWPLLLCNLCDSREGSMLKEGSMFTTNTVQTNYKLDDEDHPV